MVHSKIKAVFFDWDDNLVGTIENKWQQHRDIAKVHYGKDLTDEELKEHWGKPLTDLVGLLYGTEDIETAMSHLAATHTDYPKLLFPETKELLQTLSSRNIVLGIVTGTSRLSLTHDLETMGIETKIDYTQTLEDSEFHKPDHRVFDPAIEWLGGRNIAPEEVLYVGDGLVDMHAARGAGFEFVGTGRGLFSPEDFAEHGAIAVEHAGLIAQ